MVGITKSTFILSLAAIINEWLKNMHAKFGVEIDDKHNYSYAWNSFSVLKIANMTTMQSTEIIFDKFNVVKIFATGR